MRIAVALGACLLAASQALAAPGLGVTLTSKDGGQIYGFDIDRSGKEGVLASAETVDADNVRVSVETFDKTTGRITRSFAKEVGPRNSYSVAGIFAGATALITHFVVPDGSIFAKRRYELMSPVGAHAFTGRWTSPLKNIDVQQVGVNQDTSTGTLFAIDLNDQSKPLLIVSDVAAGTTSHVFPLDENLFGLGNGPRLSQFTAANKAVFALSPDAGTVFGLAPLNVIIDLQTGAQESFSGFNIGPFHAGSVNGLAVDPDTGIGATTTELNAQVEFYDFAGKHQIKAVQLPCTGAGDQLLSGAGIAVDPKHKLFLVTAPNYCDGSEGSAIVVYNEKAELVETITGFDFAIGEPAPAIDPKKRMGWAFGGPKGFSQLQQFFY